jgi:hypothetical protein
MAGRTVFVATYPPRRCGIATFTRDLADSIGDYEIAVLHAPGDPDAYPSEVRHRIRRDVLADYLEVARKLNRSSVGVVSVQHEFGIWGGDDGEFVLDFVGTLTKPVVTTLHTVPRNPSARQRAVLVGLIGASAASVVMSQSAARLLTRVYGIAPNLLEVVPHGVPNLLLVEPDSTTSLGRSRTSTSTTAGGPSATRPTSWLRASGWRWPAGRPALILVPPAAVPRSRPTRSRRAEADLRTRPLSRRSSGSRTPRSAALRTRAGMGLRFRS